MADLTIFDFVLRLAAGVGFLGAGVIPREGRGVRGLDTAATLRCSAAVGVPAASGRMIDRVPQRDPDTEGVRATVHLICDRADETHVRALLSQALTGDGLAPTGLRVLRDGEDTTALRAGVCLSGDPARSLERLIARLSPEPGVRDLHQPLGHSSLDTEREATAA
ncbi:MgtC/SapB family protein [Streptomyces shenzhenensis]|uniref:MgtC/SapB family protein n=1 Tax=Streptomyces shenzhenensis TaxID=943815 RepID=UPI0038117FE2